MVGMCMIRVVYFLVPVWLIIYLWFFGYYFELVSRIITTWTDCVVTVARGTVRGEVDG